MTISGRQYSANLTRRRLAVMASEAEPRPALKATT